MTSFRSEMDSGAYTSPGSAPASGPSIAQRRVVRGRGASENPANRFETLRYECTEEVSENRTQTIFFRDPSKEILARNESPDVPFDVSFNPYRGCEHGCIYCYARPTHEFLGFSAGLDFESRILVKTNAPELLKRKLSSRAWRPQVLGLAGVTDPYQPVERETLLTRRCLEILGEFRNPVGIITKSSLVARDLDLLSDLAAHSAVSVSVSITTLDLALHRIMEPRAAAPTQRLRTIEKLSRASIPTRVMVAPVIPGLTDHELPAILEAASRAGARRAGYTLIRLPHGVAPLFESWLKQHRPQRAAKVMNRIRSTRGGKRSDSKFETRMRGRGIFAEQVEQLFRTALRRSGLADGDLELSVGSFRIPPGPQLELFSQYS